MQYRIDVFETDSGSELGNNKYYTLYTVNTAFCPEELVLKLKEYKKLKSDKNFDFFCTKDCEKDIMASERYNMMYYTKDHEIISKKISRNKIYI